MGKLLLIDGHSILFRAFYGMPSAMTAPDGLHTGAVYGFLTILDKVREEEKPDYLAVAMDLPTPTFRHGLYPDYKGNRSAAPDEFREQVPVIRDLLKDMGIPVLTCEGFEADDIMGTLAASAAAEGDEVAIVSGDRDLLQVADGHITIILPKTKGGQTTYERYTPSEVKEEFGVSPADFIQLKALMGDSSDNVPGLPGVGPKTARKIMETYGSIDNARAHLEEIKPKKAMEAMRDHYDDLTLSLKLVTIRKDAPVHYDRDLFAVTDPYNEAVYADFKRLGFRSLLSRFESRQEPAATAASFHIVTEDQELEDLLSRTASAERIGLSVLCEKGRLYAACVSLEGDNAVLIPGRLPALAPRSGADGENGGRSSDAGEPSTLASRSGADGEGRGGSIGAGEPAALASRSGADGEGRGGSIGAGEPAALAILRRVLDAAREVSVTRAKEILKLLPGTDYKKLFDCVIASYLLDPLKSDWSYDAIAASCLGETVPSAAELFGKKGLGDASAKTDPGKFTDLLAACSSAEADIARRAAPGLASRLEEQGMMSLFREVEMPLTPVLADMEREGILVDREELSDYGEKLNNRIDELISMIYEEAGEEFNLNSPKQLGVVLFEKMGLPGGKKTKTGYSTAADVLEKLAPFSPLVAHILEYRTLSKLKSTYADGLAAYIEGDSRIRTTFHQTITATGRLSSADPNLQNIPMREELGRLIRKCFYPKAGCVFADADYSQIELRVLAHMSGDEKLIAAYGEERDIHRITASQVFHVPFAEVTDLQRRNAKAVNFGIVYGISSFGLSQGLSISRQEAQDYIELYFQTYPQIKSFLDGLVASAKEKGYAVSLFGRRRPVPELKAQNYAQRSFGERVAMNSPIQGTAADIIKIAMVRVYRRLKKDLPEAKLILQIHDELLVECPEQSAGEAARILQEEMKAAASLKVSLETDCHIGSNWYEAK